MIKKKSDRVIYKLSPWKNIFNNAHALYSYTDCTQEVSLIEMFEWNYSKTPAFLIRRN